MEFATLNAFNSHARSRRHKAKAAESASASGVLASLFAAYDVSLSSPTRAHPSSCCVSCCVSFTGSRAAASGDAADDAAADEPVEDDDEEGEEVLDEPEVVVRSTVGSGAPAPASSRARGGHRSESKREATADDSDGGDGGDGDGDGDDDGDDDDEGEGEDSGLTPLHCVYCSRVSADIERCARLPSSLCFFVSMLVGGLDVWLFVFDTCPVMPWSWCCCRSCCRSCCCCCL
jgi:hypothetical protein